MFLEILNMILATISGIIGFLGLILLGFCFLIILTFFLVVLGIILIPILIVGTICVGLLYYCSVVMD